MQLNKKQEQPVKKLEFNQARMRRVFSSPVMGALIGLVCLMVVLSLTSEHFLTGSNMINLLRQSAVLAIMAIGETMVIINGGIDLSVATVASLSTVIVSKYLVSADTPWGWLVLAALAAGAAVGLFNGILVTFVKIPPIIATLAVSIGLEGMALILSQGYGITLPKGTTFSVLGKGNLGFIPVPVIIMIAMYFLFYLILKRTKLGRVTYGLGGNQEAVRLSGISINRFRIAIYTISGILAAFSGIILTSRLNSGHPTSAGSMEMDAIAATILGGTSVAGGVGILWGTLIGVFVLMVIENGLNMLNISPYWQYVAKALIIIVSVGIGTMRKNNNS